MVRCSSLQRSARITRPPPVEATAALPPDPPQPPASTTVTGYREKKMKSPEWLHVKASGVSIKLKRADYADPQLRAATHGSSVVAHRPAVRLTSDRVYRNL